MVIILVVLCLAGVGGLIYLGTRDLDSKDVKRDEQS